MYLLIDIEEDHQVLLQIKGELGNAPFSSNKLDEKILSKFYIMIGMFSLNLI